MTLRHPKKERLVCHTCGYKWPIGAAINIRKAECCNNPNIHVHSLDEPCNLCLDKPNDSE